MSRKQFAWPAVAGVAVLAATGSTYSIGTHAQRPAQRSVSATSEVLPTRNQIARLFDHWNAALATGNAYRVADLYAPDAVLLPTVSARIRTTRVGIVDYFRHFLENKPVGRIQLRSIKILNRDAAIDTGLYQFTLTNKNGSKTKVNARYTFVYERHQGTWLIINHHSSMLPTGA